MNPAEFVWYENRSFGVYKLGKYGEDFLVEQSSLRYTNHFVRVPGITLLSDASVSDRQIHYVCFGHSCEQGIAYYPTIAPRHLYRSWNVSPTSSLMQLRMRKHATHKFINPNVKLQGRVVGWAGYPREIDLAGVFPKRGF